VEGEEEVHAILLWMYLQTGEMGEGRKEVVRVTSRRYRKADEEITEGKLGGRVTRKKALCCSEERSTIARNSTIFKAQTCTF
jgi:hypothetical protein